MDIIEAIKNRRSVRHFLEKEVSAEVINNILEAARWAPSGVNAQPWHVAILGPKTRQNISNDIIHARETGQAENPDYHYYPDIWVEPYKSRRKACGLALYSALNIAYGDNDRRKEQWYKNYYFFDAPCALIIYIDKNLCQGSWMDLGMFIQNIMLSARAFDIETCPQAALAEYPDIIRSHLKLSPDYNIACGISLGYADWSDPVNQYRTTREEVETFATWYD